MSALAFVHSRLNAFFGSPYFCMMFLLMFSLSTLELLPVLQASTAFAGLLAQRCSRTALQAQEAGHTSYLWGNYDIRHDMIHDSQYESWKEQHVLPGQFACCRFGCGHYQFCRGRASGRWSLPCRATTRPSK